MLRCCLIHLKKVSICQRQRNSSAILVAGSEVLFVKKTSIVPVASSKYFIRRRFVNLGFCVHWPGCFERFSNEFPCDKACFVGFWDRLRYLWDFRGIWAERKTCRDIDRDRRRFLLCSFPDIVPRIVWMSVWEDSRWFEKRWICLCTWFQSPLVIGWYLESVIWDFKSIRGIYQDYFFKIIYLIDLNV